MQNFLEKNYKIIVACALGFMLVVSVLNAYNDSAIFDETAHIPAAYSYLSQHDMRLNPEHPPLIKDLAAIPLLFMHLNFDVTKPWWTTDINGQWDAGKSFLYASGNNPDKIIFWARLPVILISLLFGLFIFKWTRELAGLTAGILALLFFAFDPNVLGHNHFVTTDLGIAAFMLFAFYFYFRFIKDPNWKNVFWAGIFLGLVQLAKFSAPTIFPILGLATIIYPLVKLKKDAAESKLAFRLKGLDEYLGKAIIVGIISLVVVWIAYFINTYKMPPDKLAETINYYFDAGDTANMKDVYTNKALIFMNNTPILHYLSEYSLGVAMVFKRVSGGNGAYFMGQVSSQGFKDYFPVVFLIKEPIPTLLLMLSALIFAFFKIFRTAAADFKDILKNAVGYLRTNILEFSMFSFILLYAYTAITSNLNIGFRHLFPILPFVYILTAKNVSEFLKNRQNHKGKLFFSSVVIFLVAYLIIETIAVYPNYMSYFNESAGGPKNGYRYATDSNADWGQDLKRLNSFLNDHPEIGLIRVDYFGGGNPAYYLGDKYEPWSDDKRPIEAGWYAISTNFLMGSLYDTTKPDDASYRWLKNKKPAFQVGTSILIYYVTPQEAGVVNNN